MFTPNPTLSCKSQVGVFRRKVSISWMSDSPWNRGVIYRADATDAQHCLPSLSAPAEKALQKQRTVDIRSVNTDGGSTEMTCLYFKHPRLNDCRKHECYRLVAASSCSILTSRLLRLPMLRKCPSTFIAPSQLTIACTSTRFVLPYEGATGPSYQSPF